MIGNGIVNRRGWSKGWLWELGGLSGWTFHNYLVQTLYPENIAPSPLQHFKQCLFYIKLCRNRAECINVSRVPRYSSVCGTVANTV